MKNRGFTLIELLAVVVILGLVGTIITVNLSSTLQKTKNDTCNAFITDIEEAACVYAGLSEKPVECNRAMGECILTLGTLVSEGLLEEKKDECTNSDMILTRKVKVYWPNGEKKCVYDKNGDGVFDEG